MVESVNLSNYLFVVEGKNDRSNLESSFDQKLNIVETEGSRINLAKRNLIQELGDKYQVVILTDPDVQGERIRKIVTDIVPDAKQLFVTKNLAIPKVSGGSLGVEHVDKDILIALLKDLDSTISDEFEEVTINDLRQYQLIGYSNSQKRRRLVSESLNIGYTNGKQFLKRLALMKIDRTKFLEMVEKLSNDSNWNN